MGDNLGQLFAPGMPKRSEAWDGDYIILWSIYIRCSNRPKLQRVHIPALEAIVGQPHGGRGWSIAKEEDLPGEFRLTSVERCPGPYSDDMWTGLLKRLYALRSFWSVTARLDPAHPYGVYVCAIYEERKPAHAPPAVSNVMVELQPDFSSLIEGETFLLGSAGQPFAK